jgi:hypothetical protein
LHHAGFRKAATAATTARGLPAWGPRLQSNEELNRKFAAVIRKLATHDKYFTIVFDELKKLNEPPTPSRKQIGFKTNVSGRQ